ncbi:Inter-alpha-trypsin inhibitor heavy chain family member 5 [Crotalus adamanteus]|uniref:Inter-alpha-trypsin inhibitor heavy chain family member 5 n=1 Tax=Crotalus adamanteus TaxID=8729 RepID=A0AAW1BDB8_CROAD
MCPRDRPSVQTPPPSVSTGNQPLRGHVCAIDHVPGGCNRGTPKAKPNRPWKEMVAFLRLEIQPISQNSQLDSSFGPSWRQKWDQGDLLLRPFGLLPLFGATMAWLFCLGCSLLVVSAQQDPELLARDLEEAGITDYNLVDNVARRVPRQTRFLQRLETRPRMSEFSVKATIISRYAFTTVSCTLVNTGSEAREGVFEMQIPITAFVSNFTMIIGGKIYYGEVIGKDWVHADQEIYSRPTNDSRENRMETFKASGLIPRKVEATFILHYEELLRRRLGKYQYTVSIRPQQLVGKLRVEVNILENSGIHSLEVLPLQNNKGKGAGSTEDHSTPPPSTMVGQTKTLAKVTFSPNLVQQAKIARNGMLGDFTIRYDVNRELSVGEVQVLDGYFVHYFAPNDLPALPKNIVFVLDRSASMVGTKMKQTKEALFTILQDLRPEDHFNVIGFSNEIQVWKEEQLVPVTSNNIRDAIFYIHRMPPNEG